jgi:hypothetical protein
MSSLPSQIPFCFFSNCFRYHLLEFKVERLEAIGRLMGRTKIVALKFWDRLSLRMTLGGGGSVSCRYLKREGQIRWPCLEWGRRVGGKIRWPNQGAK